RRNVSFPCVSYFFLTDAVKTRFADHEHATIRDRYRTDDLFRYGFSAYLILIENRTSRRTRFENEKLSVLRANVQLSVRQDGRGLLDRAEVLKPQLFSCTQVERSDVDRKS